MDNLLEREEELVTLCRAPARAVSPSPNCFQGNSGDSGMVSCSRSLEHRPVAWATTHLAGEERNWPWRLAPHRVLNPTGHFRAAEFLAKSNHHTDPFDHI